MILVHIYGTFSFCLAKTIPSTRLEFKKHTKKKTRSHRSKMQTKKIHVSVIIFENRKIKNIPIKIS